MCTNTAGESNRFPPRGDDVAEGRRRPVALVLSEKTLNELSGVWVDAEKSNVLRIAGGWTFGVGGSSEENDGVFALSLEPASSNGDRKLHARAKGWTLDDTASSSVRPVWKNDGESPKPDVVWRRRGGHPATPGERSGAEAPRGGRVLNTGEVVRYSAKVSGKWNERDAKFLKLAPAVRVIDGSPSLTVVKCPVWPADKEENLTPFKLGATEVVWFTKCERIPIDSGSHKVFFYKLADGRGWVHDYVKNAPAIRRLEVSQDARMKSRIARDLDCRKGLDRTL